MNPSKRPRRLPKISIVAAFVASFFSLSVQAEPNAQMKKVLDTYAGLAPVPLDKTTPAAARKAPAISEAVKAVMKADGKPTPVFTGTTQDIKIPANGGNVDARVYIPAGAGPFPTIFYIHGGGWVIADLDIYDSSPRGLCEMTKAVVISTHYRQAPEHKFPAAHDDTWAAYQWTLQNASRYKGDPKKVAIAGESAGGNMAASICFMAREKNVQMPVHQLLVYPVLNYAFDTPSYQEGENFKPLSSRGMKWFFGYYLASPADGANPRLSVLRQPDLKGLPPATIIGAEIDPLRSEGKTYADKLGAAGIPVTYHLYSGVTHEFFGMGAVVDEGKEAMTLASEQLRSAFGKTE